MEFITYMKKRLRNACIFLAVQTAAFFTIHILTKPAAVEAGLFPSPGQKTDIFLHNVLMGIIILNPITLYFTVRALSVLVTYTIIYLNRKRGKDVNEYERITQKVLVFVPIGFMAGIFLAVALFFAIPM